MKVYRLALAALCVLASGVWAEAQTVRTLCATGCTYTLTEANLQTCINASVGGDSCLLQENTTTDVALTLPTHTGASMVTIRTGVTSTGGVIASSQFPAVNTRVTPAKAVTAKYAILRAKTNNAPAIGTDAAMGGNGWWTLKHLSVTSNQYGGEALIRCGSDNNNAGEQDSIARIPTNFTFEQIYVYGHPVYGQFRGIRSHCNNTTIKDSDIRGIKSNSEGQVLWFNSFSTGLTVTNNYLEGGSENVMFGGSGGCCRPSITVSSAASATTFTLSARTDLFVGRHISVDMAGQEQFTYVASCGTSTADAACTSNTITVSPALGGTPAVGADVDWGPIPSDITFEKNYVTKPVSWRNPIIGTPQTLEAIASNSGGTLAAGTYAYRVVARHPFAINTTARSTASAEVAGTVGSGTTGSVLIRWAPVTNAETYYIYGRSAGGQNIRWSVTTSACSGSICSYTDTGSAGTTESVPTSAGTMPHVKNIFEIKHGRRITVRGNIFENVWKAQQDGYPILFTVSNTGGTNDSTALEDVTFTNNIVRNSAGVFMLTGRADGDSGGGSARTKNINVSNNLAYDIGSEWGVSVRTLIITTNENGTHYANNTASNGPLNATFNHNTLAQTTGNALVWFDLYKSAEHPAENFIWTNNIGYRLSYGLTGALSCTQGSGCFTMHTSGSSSWSKDVVADATCSAYPANTFCPTSTSLQANDFTDFTNRNFVLKSTSAYHNAGTDGTDLGANIPAITALTNVALSGDNTGGTPVVPPTINTTSLPAGIVGNAYTATLSGTCPSPPCVWSSTGPLPLGTTLTSTSSTTGTIAGSTLTSPGGTYNFPVTLTSGSLSSSRDYTVTIADAPAPTGDEEDPSIIPRPSRFNLDDRVLFGRETDPSVDTPEEPVRAGDLWGDLSCSSPVLKLLVGTSPAVQWRPMAFRPTLTTSTITTAGVVTYSAAQMAGGLILRDPNGAGRSDVTATATELVAVMPCAAVGDYFELDIRNTADAAETITVTAGAGVTLSGTMTIAQNNTRRFKVVLTNVGAPAVTIYSVGAFVH